MKTYEMNWREKLEVIDAAIEEEKFEPNDWEIDFLDNIEGYKTLSLKQEAALDKILDKVKKK